jgi:hypothetical protein
LRDQCVTQARFAPFCEHLCAQRSRALHSGGWMLGARGWKTMPKASAARPQCGAAATKIILEALDWRLETGAKCMREARCATRMHAATNSSVVLLFVTFLQHCVNHSDM